MRFPSSLLALALLGCSAEALPERGACEPPGPLHLHFEPVSGVCGATFDEELRLDDPPAGCTGDLDTASCATSYRIECPRSQRAGVISLDLRVGTEVRDGCGYRLEVR